MPDLAPGQPTGGPATPTHDASPPLPIPAPPAALSTDDLSQLSPEDIQARITARERDMKYRLAAIKHEVASLGDDVTFAGRPLLDWIRERKVLAVGVAAGAGALVGILWGVAKRESRRPDPDDQIDFIRARMTSLLDEAAHKVARGASTEDAMRHAMRSAPIVYTDAPARDSMPAAQTKSSVRQTIDVAVKSMLGFALKAATDQLTQKLTGHKTIGDAVKAADDD